MSTVQDHTNEQEKIQKLLEVKLEKATRLNVLKTNQDWSIIEDVKAEVLTELANEALSGDPLDHDKYLVTRAKIQGVDLFFSRLKRVEVEGKQASEQLGGFDE